MQRCEKGLVIFVDILYQFFLQKSDKYFTFAPKSLGNVRLTGQKSLGNVRLKGEKSLGNVKLNYETKDLQRVTRLENKK